MKPNNLRCSRKLRSSLSNTTPTVFLVTCSKVLVKVLSVTEERNKTEGLETHNAHTDIMYC